MKDIEHARMILDLAMGDFKALGGMADADVFDDGVFGFHVQQAQGVDVASFFDLVEYNIYAVQFRYESYQSGDEPIDREGAMGTVSNLINRVKNLLNRK